MLSARAVRLIQHTRTMSTNCGMSLCPRNMVARYKTFRQGLVPEFSQGKIMQGYDWLRVGRYVITFGVLNMAWVDAERMSWRIIHTQRKKCAKDHDRMSYNNNCQDPRHYNTYNSKYNAVLIPTYTITGGAITWFLFPEVVVLTGVYLGGIITFCAGSCVVDFARNVGPTVKGMSDLFD